MLCFVVGVVVVVVFFFVGLFLFSYLLLQVSKQPFTAVIIIVFPLLFPAYPVLPPLA